MAAQNGNGVGLARLSVVGVAAWVVPGGGYFVLGDRPRAWVVLTAVVLTFATGLYVGSIGVVNPVTSKPWYVAQVMNSPAVLLLGGYVGRAHRAAEASVRLAPPREREQALLETQSLTYRVYGRPNEVGQIYTSIAGLLNLLCIVNAMYRAHVGPSSAPGD